MNEAIVRWQKQNKWLRWLTALFVASFLLLGLEVNCMPYTDEVRRHTVLKAILVNEEAETVIHSYNVVALALVLFICLMSIRSRQYKRLWWIFGVSGAYVGTFVILILRTLLSYQPFGSLQVGEDRYRFFEFSFLQGQTMVLGKLESSGWQSNRYACLVETNGDSPRSYVRMVRPAGEADEYGSLRLYGSKVLGFRYSNRLFMAYDMVNKKPYARETIFQFSPFMLLGAKSTPDENDVEEMLELGVGTAPEADRKRMLEDGLKHANPAVRDLAKRLLAKYPQP